ncbi:MAG: hypothetical protein WDN46_25360 [Methylocella sp.]
MWQRAGEAGYGQPTQGLAIGDGADNARRQECERHQESDMALGEILGGGDVVERRRLACED